MLVVWEQHTLSFPPLLPYLMYFHSNCRFSVYWTVLSSSIMQKSSIRAYMLHNSGINNLPKFEVVQTQYL